MKTSEPRPVFDHPALDCSRLIPPKDLQGSQSMQIKCHLVDRPSEHKISTQAEELFRSHLSVEKVPKSHEIVLKNYF